MLRFFLFYFHLFGVAFGCKAIAYSSAKINAVEKLLVESSWSVHKMKDEGRKKGV